MERPIIHISLDRADKIIEGFGILALLCLILYPAYYFQQLPEFIPKHFGLDGKADAFGQKMTLWILPIIGTLLYLFLSYIGRKPHLFNYPTEINEANAEKIYSIGAKLIRLIKLISTVFFAYISMSTVNIALEKQQHLGTYALIGFILIPFLVIIWSLVNISKVKSVNK